MVKHSFHIETTNKCIIECPECARTWFKKKFPKLKQVDEIDIDLLCNFLEGKTEYVNFEGINGDTIYHSRILELIERLKKMQIRISMTTNGSGKPIGFWHNLKKLLTANDRIVFSLDGLEDTNHIYRINSKWKTIVPALELFGTAEVYTRWKFIVFKHNEHQIYKCKKYSEELGFNKFKIISQYRQFDSEYDQGLLPENTNFINQDKVDVALAVLENKQIDSIRPICITEEGVTLIDCHGNIFPCCMLGNYRTKYHTMWSPKQSTFNIANNTIEEIFNRTEVKEWYNSTKHLATANKYCKLFCGIKND